MSINSPQATRFTGNIQLQHNRHTDTASSDGSSIIRDSGILYNIDVAPSANRRFKIETIAPSKRVTLSSVTCIVDLLLSSSLTTDEDFFKSVKEMKKAILSANTLLSLQYTITHVKNTLLEQLIKLDYEVLQSLKEIFKKDSSPEDPFHFIFELVEIEQRIDQLLQNNIVDRDSLLIELVDKLAEMNEFERSMKTALSIFDSHKRDEKLLELLSKDKHVKTSVKAFKCIQNYSIRKLAFSVIRKKFAELHSPNQLSLIRSSSKQKSLALN